MNDPLDARLGQRLQRARTQQGMTVDQLAAALGMEACELRRYEAGAQRMTSNRLVRACDILSVEPLYFFRDQRS